MAGQMKTQREILDKLKIEALNPMQEAAAVAIHDCSELVLLSPTGSGKTLGFLLPIIEFLDPDIQEVQALILVPSRELAIQIEQVFRDMGTGFKANAVYGGRSGSKEKTEINHPPALLIGTPGRVADHLRRGRFSTQFIQSLVLDEFDKSLEIGFEQDMREIIEALPPLRKKILTSATHAAQIPDFVGFRNPLTLDFSSEVNAQLEIKSLESAPGKKLNLLIDSLLLLNPQAGIVFCNFKDSIAEVSDALWENSIEHACFHGDMEQKDRERVLIKFRNGSLRLIVATDLAARGLDIPEIQYIMHFQLPNRLEEFTHRNGRTARMKKDGVAYVLLEKGEKTPEYLPSLGAATLQNEEAAKGQWKTLLISGGRKDKISKGDIAGLFFKQGQLQKEQLGIIELKHDCAFVSVEAEKVAALIDKLNNSRLKTKRVRVSLV